MFGCLNGRWYGAFLLACYDPDLEEYQSVCKVGTGFSEERLAKFATDLKELVIPRKPNYYKVRIVAKVLALGRREGWELPGSAASDFPEGYWV